jgi:hypothetical protein
MGTITHVTIDFETSHLVFPALIGVILALLGIAIVAQNRHAIGASGRYWRGVFRRMDKARFFGTLALTLVYFGLMVPVGNIWPNLGLGFLICSIPFVLLTGLLFMHERSLHDVLPLLAVAIIVPLVVWWLFTYLFFLTLP